MTEKTISSVMGNFLKDLEELNAGVEEIVVDVPFFQKIIEECPPGSVRGDRTKFHTAQKIIDVRLRRKYAYYWVPKSNNWAEKELHEEKQEPKGSVFICWEEEKEQE